MYRHYIEHDLKAMTFTQFELMVARMFKLKTFKIKNSVRLVPRKYYKPIYMKIRRELPIYHKRRLYTKKMLEDAINSAREKEIDKQYVKTLFECSKDYLLEEDKTYIRRLIKGLWQDNLT